MPSQQPQKEQDLPPFRGLYKHVHISVKALDWIIAACIAVIVLVLIIDLQTPGFTVNFDSRGGSDVESVHRMYGEQLSPPESPTREGYVFTGWYKDSAALVAWDLETDEIVESTTVYAGWEKVVP